MMQIPRRRLGETGLDVPLMGVGSGGPSRLGQHQGATQRSVEDLVGLALDLGANLFDTAPLYGESEQLLGDVLSRIERDRYLLSTKFRPLDGDGAVLPESHLIESLERSIRRLRTEHIDLFFLHAVPPDIFDRVWATFGPALDRAKDLGMIGHVGVSEAYVDDHTHQTVRDAIATTGVDVVMVGYNLLSPSARDGVFGEAAGHGVGVVVACAIRKVISDPVLCQQVIDNWKSQGLLDDGVPSEGTLDWLLEEAPTITAAAYRFAAQPEEVSCVLTGTSSPEHLRENAEAISGPPLSERSIERIWRTFGPVGRNVSPRDATPTT